VHVFFFPIVEQSTRCFSSGELPRIGCWVWSTVFLETPASNNGSWVIHTPSRWIIDRPFYFPPSFFSHLPIWMRLSWAAVNYLSPRGSKLTFCNTSTLVRIARLAARRKFAFFFFSHLSVIESRHEHASFSPLFPVLIPGYQTLLSVISRLIGNAPNEHHMRPEYNQAHRSITSFLFRGVGTFLFLGKGDSPDARILGVEGCPNVDFVGWKRQANVSRINCRMCGCFSVEKTVGKGGCSCPSLSNEPNPFFFLGAISKLHKEL
jgi:hypothetical protein